MSVKSFAENIIGFISHYGSEVNGIADALDAVVNAVPMQKSDAQKILSVIDQLKNAGNNISTTVGNIGVNITPVQIAESDIETALKNVLNGATIDPKTGVVTFATEEAGATIASKTGVVTSATEEAGATNA